ncbi:GNAT family protein [Sulfitobacter sp. LCG007]
MTLKEISDSRPLGRPVPDWKAPPAPSGEPLCGAYAEIEALDPDRHAAALFEAFAGHDSVWDYLPYGPFDTREAYADWTRKVAEDPALRFYAIRNLASMRWEGVASFLRIDPPAGSIEVGHINFSPALQRTRAATEAMYLMMDWAFSRGYRRYEWKCNALNGGSRRAAARLGLSFEGIFRNHLVVKGRNRDTAWFAATSEDWPALKEAFGAWLTPSNFDARGMQIRSLASLTEPVLVARDPAG